MEWLVHEQLKVTITRVLNLRNGHGHPIEDVCFTITALTSRVFACAARREASFCRGVRLAMAHRRTPQHSRRRSVLMRMGILQCPWRVGSMQPIDGLAVHRGVRLPSFQRVGAVRAAPALTPLHSSTCYVWMRMGAQQHTQTAWFPSRLEL